MTFVPVGIWSPDAPDFMNPGSALVQNVLPRTSQSYGPFPGLTVVSTALTGRCEDAYSMVDTAGNARLLAGDAAKLYRMSPANAGPVDVSKVGGYATGSTERWSMTLFGVRVVATNFTDPPQSYVEGTSEIGRASCRKRV